MRGPKRGVFLLLLLAIGCHSAGKTEVSVTPTEQRRAEGDPALERCRERLRLVQAAPGLPGAPDFEARRVEILGRVRGSAAFWVREPRPDPDLVRPELRSRGSVERPHARIRALIARHRDDRRGLRGVVLRENYLYSSDPEEALALTSLLTLDKLFDEPSLVLERGAIRQNLERSKVEAMGGVRFEYRHADGPSAGRRAELLFGDRVTPSASEPSAPLHRDFAALAAQTGFDRVRVRHVTEAALVAELRFGDVFSRALLESTGASLSFACLDAALGLRQAILAWQAGHQTRERSLARLRAAVDQAVDEALPFDRPRDEETPERDGELRPEWRWAYKTGRSLFQVDDVSYPVFDGRGRPHPPQVCVDFVLDSYERASGSWYRPRGEPPGRSGGAIDFDAEGIDNRRAVLAFEKFAAGRPDLFEVVRFEPEERIPYRETGRFFRFLSEHAERFATGDIIAIQGLKADGRIHQHAILIEATDPLTGFPHALADQMRGPRRRSWNAIMAEAPLRSLLYRVRPRAKLLSALNPAAVSE